MAFATDADPELEEPDVPRRNDPPADPEPDEPTGPDEVPVVPDDDPDNPLYRPDPEPDDA